MNYEKTIEFVRQTLLVLVIFYLTKKIFSLEDRVTYLEQNKSEDEVPDEYSTENNIKIFNDAIKKQLNNVSTINVPPTLFVSVKPTAVVEEVNVETQSSTKEEASDASKTPGKMSLKEVQEIAKLKNIDLKVSGKSKSKKQLIEEINFSS